ncbi:MAG: hypothetical protein ABR557_14355 [Pyrinomonadaceae bacterium]
MADIEVENILREIRERVNAEREASTAARLNDENVSETSRENGQLESVDLAHLESYLTTTARAWDRLPPLVSNRSGTTARLELWLKRHLKRATRWYAWEQVNFNAAVHHGLREVVQLFSAYEKKLANQRQQLLAEKEARRAEAQRHQSEMQLLRVELDTQRATIGAQQHDAKLAAIVNELREANERLQEEQRVSYKQLALETSEAAVFEDRARRKTDALLEQLRRRIEQLEGRES